MLEDRSWELRHRVGAGAAAVACFLVLAWIGSGGALPWRASSYGTPLSSMGAGVLGGLFVAAAACAAVVTWRRQIGPSCRWTVITGVLVATQSLVAAVAVLGGPRPGEAVLGVLLVVSLAGLAAVIGPMFRPAHSDQGLDAAAAWGLGLGLVAAGQLSHQVVTATAASTSRQALVAVLVCTHVAATAVVLRRASRRSSLSGLLLATLLVVDVDLIAPAAAREGASWAALGPVALAVAGATWLTIAWVSLQRALVEDRLSLETVQHVLAATSREHREQMHELRSTLAGLVTGSDLLDSPDLTPEMRDRFWASLRCELGRMDRLMSGRDQSRQDLELDEALSTILDLQRLKGRQVELHSTGDVVQARFDALAEVVNILMDNAATHGGTDHSRIEVERRDDETVDITVTDFGRGIPEEQQAEIFDWGKRGSDSPGEGIGLNVAQRLVEEDGGELRLADQEGAGSSFVISLPAARRSSENDLSKEPSHVRRYSG